MATKKALPPRVMAGMTVGRQKPRSPGMGDVKAADHSRVERERKEREEAKKRAKERKEMLAKKGGEYA